MLFIFDVDGTIVDNLQDFVTCINNIVVRHGFNPFSREKVQDTIGFGCEHTIHSLLPEIGAELQRILADEYRDSVKAIQNEPRALFNDAADVMMTLSDISRRSKDLKHPLKLALLSNKEHDATLIIADKLFSSLSFDIILGADECRRSKPHPDGILEIMKHCNAMHEETWMIGDTIVDVKAGAAAGVNTIACTWGFHTKESLMACTPTHIVDTWKELGALLLRILSATECSPFTA